MAHYVKYVTSAGATGATPGADSNTYTLFNSTWMATGPQGLVALGMKKLWLDLKYAKAGTLKWYKSPDHGTTWHQIDQELVPIPATTATLTREYITEPYADFKLDWVNGGSAQTTWAVSMVISEDHPVGPIPGTSASAMETVVVDLSGNSPASATTVAGVSSLTLGYDDLADLENFKLQYTIAGTDGTPSGGTIDAYIQCTADGTTWYDWYHIAQVTSGAVAIIRTQTFALSTANVAVGSGTSPALSAGVYAGGHPGKGVRVMWVTGVGTNHAVAQTIQLIGTRKAS